MCWQVEEVYSACRCVYYKHAVDICPDFSRPNHTVSKRTIQVGYACSTHSSTISSISSEVPSEYDKPVLGPSSFQNPRPQIFKSRKPRSYAWNFPNLDSNPPPHQETQAKRSHVDELQLRKDYITTSKAEEALTEQTLIEQSDSDDSIDSRSTISLASTATTVDENALEALFRGLLTHGSLYNLWPQIVAGQLSLKDARQTIDRFLRRFAEDLECLAAKPSHAQDEGSRRIILSSSKFMRRHRVEIASRICQAYETQSKSSDVDTSIEDTEIHVTEDVSNTEIDSFTFRIAEEFIFETAPISYLEANLCAFIRQRRQKRFSRLATNLRAFTSLAVQVFRQTPVTTEKRRVSWTCICGCRIVDDYESEYEGAIDSFELQLKQYNQLEQSVQQDTDTNQGNVVAQHSWKETIHTTLQWFSETLLKEKPGGLPSHRYSNNDPLTQSGSCARSAGSALAYHRFVLLCIPYLRWGLQLYNSDVCKINSDQQFFRLLRHCYFDQRCVGIRAAIRMFTKVRALQFVKFEVFRNKLVDVRVCPSMPTVDNDYTYDPMPPDVIPPIGPNLLMHLFENPDHADITLLLYNRFPKKMRVQLEACPTKGSSIGWGVQFVEGVNWYAVFLLTCFGFLFCLLFAVAWSAAKGDVQGGFGIASFLLTFFVFCGGIMHTMG